MSSYTIRSDTMRTLVIAPNGSLSAGYAQWFLICMCTLSIAIASILTWRGLWLIWPFAALEMGTLGYCLYVSVRNNRYREVVSVYEDTVEIDSGCGRPERHWEFPRLLTQVQLRAGDGRNSPSRLLLLRSGRGCELGRCLTDEEKSEVAARLRNWIRTPELGTGPGE